MRKFKPGFTLIELLVVIVIIGILATIGIGNFASARVKARDAKRKNDLQTIAKSLEAYANDHRNYPRSSSGKIICIDASNTICDWGTPFQDTLDGSGALYTASLPKDTSDPNHYYFYESSGVSYTIYAYLENERDPSAVTIPGSDCGDSECNYKLTSSNLAN